MRMHLLDCGMMDIPYSNILHNEESKPGMFISVPVEAFLIEHREGLILFDTGCDPNGIAGNWPEEYRKIPYRGKHLPERLQALGIKFDDIMYVIASHLHFDHAGCLSLFRKARIFVSETELKSTLHAYQNQLDLNAHLKSDIKSWIQADLQWERVSFAEVRLADGITIINFGPGHSWGMLGLKVELPVSGNYFLVADAIYTRKNQGPPQKLLGLLHDREGYQKTVALIESYASENHATIIYGHDPDQFQSLLKRANGWLE